MVHPAQPTMELSNTDATIICLGIEFPDDKARQSYFSLRLVEHLLSPDFRNLLGFLKASNEEIVRLSDAPYFTACPNPFLKEMLDQRKITEGHTSYFREPFAIDVSVGKTDSLYRAHSYHTKVPHQAIVPSILHYTVPGDVILDGFCGSGMTGLAAIFCESPPKSYKAELERQAKTSGSAVPSWGKRYTLLSDLSPAATFIAANYCTPFSIEDFQRDAQQILQDVDGSIGWMYQTLHSDGNTIGTIEYTV